MNELVDEILSDETILLNEALQMIRAEMEKLDPSVRTEITEDLKHAISKHL